MYWTPTCGMCEVMHKKNCDSWRGGWYVTFCGWRSCCGREVVFFFQAEDGIRDIGVTGVQTCALPISFASGRTGVGGPTSISGLRREENPEGTATTRAEGGQPWGSVRRTWRWYTQFWGSEVPAKERGRGRSACSGSNRPTPCRS